MYNVRFFVFGLCFSVTVAGASDAAQSSCDEGSVSCQVLEIERSAGATDREFQTLDFVARGAISFLRSESALRDDGHYSKKEAQKIIKLIKRHLKKNVGFTYDRSREGVLYLHTALRANRLDCDSTAFIYLEVARRLNLPIRAVFAPQHVFLRWATPEWSFNWDTTEHLFRKDKWFVGQFKIAPEAIEAGVYMKSLSNDELLAIPYHTVAQYFAFQMNDLPRAIEYVDQAIEHYPKLSLAYLLRAELLLAQNDPDGSLLEVEHALQLDPHCPYGQALWAYLTAKDDPDRAINFLDESISRGFGSAILYYVRASLLWFKAKLFTQESSWDAQQARGRAWRNLENACALDSQFCDTEFAPIPWRLSSRYQR